MTEAYLYRTSNDVAKVRQALRQVQWLPPKQGETSKPQEFAPYEKNEEVSPLCRRIQNRIEQADTRHFHKLSNFMERRRRVHMDDSLQMPGLALSWYCRRTRR
ncbi:hypothetical protein AAVH_22801 [Aphelenchoides avenae]|nr:hypothetical protein AAVH_22801 [Aphelenchus avenae]